MFDHEIVIITDNDSVILYSSRSSHRIGRQKLRPAKFWMTKQEWDDILKWTQNGI